MPLTRPFAIDQAYANASDFRKQQATVFAREGIFPDPTSLATAGIVYANGGWNVGARAFTGVARRGTSAYSQSYGGVLFSNDSQGTAWTIPAAPATGSRIDVLWVQLTDPTQGESTTTPSGETVPRAVPVFGVTSGDAGTSPVARALPSGVFEIARVTTSSTATTIANSVITQTYPFANVLGAPIYYRTYADMIADSGSTARGETAIVMGELSTWKRLSTAAGEGSYRIMHSPTFNRNFDLYYEGQLAAGVATTLGSTTLPAMPFAYRAVVMISGTGGGNGSAGGNYGVALTISGPGVTATPGWGSRTSRYRPYFSLNEYAPISRAIRIDVPMNSSVALGVVADTSTTATLSIDVNIACYMAGEF